LQVIGEFSGADIDGLQFAAVRFDLFAGLTSLPRREVDLLLGAAYCRCVLGMLFGKKVPLLFCFVPLDVGLLLRGLQFKNVCFQLVPLACQIGEPAGQADESILQFVELVEDEFAAKGSVATVEFLECAGFLRLTTHHTKPSFGALKLLANAYEIDFGSLKLPL
jgi:hypothetical protein